MNAYVVIMSPQARRQIMQQVEFISNDSVLRAEAWRRRLEGAIEQLAEFHGYAVDLEATKRTGMKVQKLVFEQTYQIRYRVDETAREVRILNFRHGARRRRKGET